MGSDGVAAQAFEEDRDTSGRTRPGYRKLMEALDGVDLAALTAAVSRQLERDGVSFGGNAFVVDPVPRILHAAEWDDLTAGLAQRARALNRFLRDAYGEQRVVAAGLLPEATLHEAEGFEGDLLGHLPPGVAPAAVIGFDVVRAPSGEFLVLEDNARTPSGISYATGARAALASQLPATGLRPRPIDPVIYELLGLALRAAAPRDAAAEPRCVALTDGPLNVAYFEHSLAARRMGMELVTPEDLVAEGDRLHIRGGERIDVVYRRTDEDRLRDESGRATEVGSLLTASWLNGKLGLVNAFGNGIADDKLVHAHVEDFIRFYLREEPLMSSVPTHQLRTREDARETAKRLRQLVVKPRHGHGGKGVVIGAHADTEDLVATAEELESDPQRFISQPVVPLSRHPTVIEGRLEPRHVDLRVFAFCIGDRVEIAPGGLSRVALDAGALVVNSSQNGGGKDTWVID
jgi:uncharacterized circularly permuted ATP-grasp superfamily protein